jgi:uncharacterized protein (TIGR02217 family)
MFYEISFPIAADYGSSGGFLCRTVLNETQGGDFTPQSLWDEPVREFTIECSSYAPGDFDKVNSFFLLVRGKNKGFRFKVPNDYTGTDEFIGVGDGTTDSFQLKKNYDDVVVPHSIVAVSTDNSTVTIRDADVQLLTSGSIFSVTDSTGNDGYYVSQGAVAQSYSPDIYDSSMYAFYGADYSGEFYVNQKITISHGGVLLTRYVLSCVFSGGDTLLTLKSAVSGGSETDVIYANTTITATPSIVSSVVDGSVGLFVSRDIIKPVESVGVVIKLNDSEKTEGSDYNIDYTTGIVTFDPAPADGDRIVASSFEYDIPVLLMSDKLDASFDDWEHATFSVPVKEWRSPS